VAGMTGSRTPTQMPEGGWAPIPDPTVLTATAVSQAKEDLRRELTSIQTLLAERILRAESILRDLDMRLKGDIASTADNLQALVVQRFEAVEASMRMLPEEQEKLRQGLREDIQIAVVNLQHLHEERFSAIQQQFEERDVRSEQDKKSSKDALDAALLAQKESVSQQNDANTTAATKTEASFTKQIDLVGTQISALDKSWTDRFTELKERIDRGEGQGQGAADVRGANVQSVNTRLVALGLALSVVVIIVNVAIALVIHK
jgi:hypothetical protein